MKKITILITLMTVLLFIAITAANFYTKGNLLRFSSNMIKYYFLPTVMVFNRGDNSQVKIIGGFESSNIFNIKKISNNHFSVMMKPDEPSDHNYPDHMLYWFYLKITEAKDRTITIDITNAEWMPSHWDNYTPVYTYVLDPNDLTDHKWDRITDVTRFFTTFSFTHTFTSDTVWVALRYPYTYTYGQRYISSIKNNPYATVETVGKTGEGRNVDLIVVTDKNVSDKEKKGIWLIAKEHASEQDGVWMMEGIIKFLLSDDPNAAALRKKTVFAMIPLAAPDATYHGRTVNPVTGYDISHRYDSRSPFKGRTEGMTEETEAILRRVKRWIEEGNHLDIAAILHNPHGDEQNVWGMFSDAYKVDEHKAFHNAFLKNLNGFTTRTDTIGKPLPKDLFPGKVASAYGSLGFIYEINHQAKGSFLTIKDLHKIGEAFAKGVFDYFNFSIK